MDHFDSMVVPETRHSHTSLYSLIPIILRSTDVASAG